MAEYAIALILGVIVGTVVTYLIIRRTPRLVPKGVWSEQRKELYRELAMALGIFIMQLETRIQMEMYAHAFAPGSPPTSKQEEVEEEYRNAEDQVTLAVFRSSYLFSEEVADALIRLLAQLREGPSAETDFKRWTHALAEDAQAARQCFELMAAEGELGWKLPR